MKRRKFITVTTIATTGFIAMPQNTFAMQRFTKDELIGKGNPLLFGDGINIRKEAYNAFIKMQEAAKKDNIVIKVVSSYRDFFRQKAIYESKYKRFTAEGLSPLNSIKKIIEYSTIPGTSRHHWGTDIDIIDGNSTYSGDVLVADKFHGNGPFCKFKEWMDIHAASFGFHLVYTNDGNRKGFKYEPWHYSFAALSKPMLKEYQKLNIKEILIHERLLGKEYLSDAFMNEYLKNNILDINPELL